ncbi:MAG: hypothetical protein IPL79_09875 [Myxococcales bacterium]|nr:hypothetical protein [Myxococcales bacterium]
MAIAVAEFFVTEIQTPQPARSLAAVPTCVRCRENDLIFQQYQCTEGFKSPAPRHLAPCQPRSAFATLRLFRLKFPIPPVDEYWGIA